jgi:uncharacterized protein
MGGADRFVVGRFVVGIFSGCFFRSRFAALPFSLVLPALVLLGLAGPAQSQQPSFDCARDRRPDEVTICGSSALADYDRRMSDLYFDVFGQLDSTQQGILRDSQRTWLRQRRACGSSSRCIAALYQQRLQQLNAFAAAPSPPDPVTPAPYIPPEQPYTPPPVPYTPPPVQRTTPAVAEPAPAAGRAPTGQAASSPAASEGQVPKGQNPAGRDSASASGQDAAGPGSTAKKQCNDFPACN